MTDNFIDNFIVVINSHGRPNCSSYKVLRDAGYTGRITFTIDTEDSTYQQYVDNYGPENVFLFEKRNDTKVFDVGDNFDGPMGVVAFARNESFSVARKCGAKYFCAVDDDLKTFAHRFVEHGKIRNKKVKNANAVFAAYVDFLEESGIDCVGFCHSVHCMGGAANFEKQFAQMRGVLNTYILKTSNQFPFDARICEDCATLVEQSIRGKVFLIHPSVMSECGIWNPGDKPGTAGMQETYKNVDSYVMRFYVIMRQPGASYLRMTDGGYQVSLPKNNVYPLILSQGVQKHG